MKKKIVMICFKTERLTIVASNMVYQFVIMANVTFLVVILLVI